ncbi:MAG: magnesium transporter [Deltaproteobacteria bacterium]|nr:magnesium transporter [Deltaproteobacteria bacterium]
MRVAVAIVPEVRELLNQDSDQLGELLQEIHDEDIADLLKLLDDDEAIQVLEQLDVDSAADIFERLDEADQAAWVAEYGAERLAPILSEMAPDDLTDLVGELPDRVGDRLLDTVAPDMAAEVEELLAWADDTAGGLMTTEYVAVAPNLTVNEVIAAVREQGEEVETVYYCYAVERDNMLVGVASLRDLILAEGDDPLRDVMTENVVTVAPETDQEEVAHVLNRYDFTAIPVLDAEGRMLGLITHDDVMDVMVEEQTEDVQRLAAVEPIDEAYFQTTFWKYLNKRAPWLAVLFVGQFITESVLRHYDPVIQAVTQLTYYLPLLVATGGNSGAQSASLIIRGLGTGEISVRDWWRVLVRELGQGLVLGVALAAVGMARVWMVGDLNGMVLTIGITVVAIVLTGCTIGGMLPLLLKRLGLDPATSSTPAIATIVDVFGILLYFTVAQLVLAKVLSQAGL